MALSEVQLDGIELELLRYQKIDILKEKANFLAEKRRQKLQLLTMAKELIIENRRDKPVGEKDVFAEDIVAFANELYSCLDLVE